MELLVGEAIATGIADVLRDQDDERIVTVAFVGRNPLAWIPTPRGLKLYCWPMAGATHPDGIRALVAAGVDVTFVRRLHTKIYWSRQHGAVLGSANLSQSALGIGGLYEAAVRFAPGTIDIAKILAMFDSESLCSSSEMEFATALARLDVEHAIHQQRNGATIRMADDTPIPTFGEWLDSPFRKRWQIAYWSEAVDANPVNPDEKDQAWNYANTANDSYPKALELAVPTLEIQLEPDGKSLAKRSRPFWWYPEKTWETDTPDYKDAKHTWVCSTLIPPGESVPFKVDTKFRKALQDTIENCGDHLRNVNGQVDHVFLGALQRAYRR